MSSVGRRLDAQLAGCVHHRLDRRAGRLRGHSISSREIHAPQNDARRRRDRSVVDAERTIRPVGVARDRLRQRTRGEPSRSPRRLSRRRGAPASARGSRRAGAPPPRTAGRCAASCISSCKVWMSRPRSSGGTSVRSNTADALRSRPRPRAAPTPHAVCVALAVAADHLEDVGDLLAHRLRVDAVLLVVLELLLAPPVRLARSRGASSRSSGRRT